MTGRGARARKLSPAPPPRRIATSRPPFDTHTVQPWVTQRPTAEKTAGIRHRQDSSERMKERARPMNMTHITYFVAAATLGSFSLAAQENDVTYQAVSKSIANLEAELGEELFVRDGRGVSLTPFGSGLLEKAVEVKESFNELKAFAAHEARRRKGSTVIDIGLCIPPFCNDAKLRRGVERFVQTGMERDVHVIQCSWEKGLTLLSADKIDALVTLGAPPKSSGCNVSAIGTVPAGLIMGPNHPLAARDDITLEDVAAYPVLIDQRFDCFFDEMYPFYGPKLPDVRLSVDDSDAFHFQELGLVLTPGVPTLGIFPIGVMRFLPELETKKVPLCVVSIRGAKSSRCRAFEKFLYASMLNLMSHGV
ncbi:LysR family transcriptional regulator [Eggerthellaceae bacterium zg-893]|nr:LysR family transcriptional regulator [Eggerthellaceae bacterium zg-893]